MKKEWIGKIGNTVYKIDISDVDIFPQGFEFNLKLMDNSLWLDGYSKESLKKSINELGNFMARLDEAYHQMVNFTWDDEKEKEYRKSLRSTRISVVEEQPKKVKKAKKASGG